MKSPTMCFSCTDQTLFMLYGQTGAFANKLREAEREFVAYLESGADSDEGVQLTIECYACGRVSYERVDGGIRWRENPQDGGIGHEQGKEADVSTEVSQAEEKRDTQP